MPSRLVDLRRSLIERGRGIKAARPARMPDAIVRAIGEQQAAADAAGTELPRDWQALHHRAEVERLSLEGMTVAEIAATLNLSASHVVVLRAQLGVGRKR